MTYSLGPADVLCFAQYTQKHGTWKKRQQVAMFFSDFLSKFQQWVWVCG